LHYGPIHLFWQNFDRKGEQGLHYGELPMLFTAPLAWLYWNPNREAFTIPYFDLSIAWYGIIFSTGFIVGYFLFIPILREYFLRQSADRSPASVNQARQNSRALADALTWYALIGTVVGARLGHVFFYDWPYFREHLFDILLIRQGGLASHGGTIGVLLALWLFLRRNKAKFAPYQEITKGIAKGTSQELSFIALLDLLCIPTAFAAACIRIGNFFNQEIVGLPTSLPWAILFGDPAEGVAAVPRHPVQLYEAIAYLCSFGLLYFVWKKFPKLKTGTLSGIFFILIFGSRFLIEFLKIPLNSYLDVSQLQIGQYLSLPFILLGVALLPRRKRHALQSKR
jgi:phosphatidylglycerol---prolipoprotein diacylglyceryl transferase